MEDNYEVNERWELVELYDKLTPSARKQLLDYAKNIVQMHEADSGEQDGDRG